MCEFAVLVIHAMRDTQGVLALSDTSPEVLDVYFRRLTEMTPSERLAIGAALWKAGDSLQRAAARRSTPEADEAEIAFRIAITRYGLELARKAYQRT